MGLVWSVPVSSEEYDRAWTKGGENVSQMVCVCVLVLLIFGAIRNSLKKRPFRKHQIFSTQFSRALSTGNSLINLVRRRLLNW